MDFDYSPKTKELQARLLKFMDDHIYPAEAAYAAELAANTAAGKRWTPLQTIENLKLKAQAAGLWNLVLPVPTAEASGSHAARPTPATWRPLHATAPSPSRHVGCASCWTARSVRPSL